MSDLTTSQKLTKWANFLENVDDVNFDMDFWIKKYDETQKCGTVCCAGGWLLTIFPQLKPSKSLFDEEVCIKFLDIDRNDWERITQPTSYIHTFSNSGIPKTVVISRIRQLAYEYELVENIP